MSQAVCLFGGATSLAFGADIEDVSGEALVSALPRGVAFGSGRMRRRRRRREEEEGREGGERRRTPTVATGEHQKIRQAQNPYTCSMVAGLHPLNLERHDCICHNQRI